MRQPSYLCSCILCGKSTTSLGIVTHFIRAHGDASQKAVFNGSIAAKKQLKCDNLAAYNSNPKLCKRCSQPLTYDSRRHDYCSRSCAATVNNASRNSSFVIMTKNKSLTCVSCNVVEIVDSRRSGKNFKCESCKIACQQTKVMYPQTKVHPVACKFCNFMFYSHKPVSVCKNCQHLKWSNNKDQYSFKFNVFEYPNLFDLDLVTKVGWVSFGGKRGGNYNPNGISRDHKVSVSDAKKHGYDPYYISHPLNCELMPHTVNNKKKSKSSLTYTELVDLVDQYDKKNYK